MELQEILKELEFNTGTLPRQALEQAVLKREEIIPELLKILEYTKSNAEKLIKQEAYFAHIYAMFLLAQFREKSAYPLIVDFFSIPGRLSLDLTGDVVTEDLCRILASVSCGDTRLMEALVENDKINEYVRKAALRGFLALVVSGEKLREEIISYYKSLFREKLTKETYDDVWGELVLCATKLYPEELYEDIKLAYEEELVDPGYIKIEYIDERMACDKDEILTILQKNKYCKLIKNTISELENWHCFRPISKSPSSLVKKIPQRKEKKTGRRSGKKYKKCCLN
jgi:hypothetical protein